MLWIHQDNLKDNTHLCRNRLCCQILPFCCPIISCDQWHYQSHGHHIVDHRLRTLWTWITLLQSRPQVSLAHVHGAMLGNENESRKGSTRFVCKHRTEGLGHSSREVLAREPQRSSLSPSHTVYLKIKTHSWGPSPCPGGLRHHTPLLWFTCKPMFWTIAPCFSTNKPGLTLSLGFLLHHSHLPHLAGLVQANSRDLSSVSIPCVALPGSVNSNRMYFQIQYSPSCLLLSLK